MILVLPIFGPIYVNAATAEEIKQSLQDSLPETRVARDGEQKPSVGVHFGTASVRNDRSPGQELGIEVGVQPLIPFSTAVELSAAVIPNKGDSATLTRTKLFFKGNYNFGGSIPVIRYSYVGVGAGLVFDNLASKSDLQLGWAPQLGFDIPLGTAEKYSLGANANYMMSGGDKAGVLALNAMAKYWF